MKFHHAHIHFITTTYASNKESIQTAAAMTQKGGEILCFSETPYFGLKEHNFSSALMNVDFSYGDLS